MYLVDTHNGAALNLNLSAIGVFQLFAKVIGRKVAAILSLTKLLQSLPYKFWQPFKVCTAQPTTPVNWIWITLDPGMLHRLLDFSASGPAN